MRADHGKMKCFICERIPDGGTRIVLADGPEGGPAWADLTPLWDEAGECDLLLDSNESEWVSLAEVYDHLRLKEMTWREWLRSSLPRADGTPRCPKTPLPGGNASTETASLAGRQPSVDQGRVGEYLTLTEVAKFIPGRRPGKRVSLGTIWRWCTQGLRKGIRLKSVLAGGQRCTTRQWVQEFIDAMTQEGQPQGQDRAQVRTPTQRQTASERASEELKAAWDGRRPG